MNGNSDVCAAQENIYYKLQFVSPATYEIVNMVMCCYKNKLFFFLCTCTVFLCLGGFFLLACNRKQPIPAGFGQKVHYTLDESQLK